MCGFKKICGRGVNIISMVCLNSIGRLIGTDVPVGGGNDGHDVSV